MIWANFLHIYQPPHQKRVILKEIVETSYRKILDLLEHRESAKLTLNISASLTEQLAKEGFRDVINRIKSLAEKGRIELTGTAKYHPLLPLLPLQEIRRQIRLNEKTNRVYFGRIFSPRGLHLPEMAYSKSVARVANQLGYRWIILNETSYRGKLFSDIRFDRLFRIKDLSSLSVFFRSRKISDFFQRATLSTISDLQKLVRETLRDSKYFITAMDGETFGHHRKKYDRFLDEVYGSGLFRAVTVSDLFSLFSQNVEWVNPVPSSWASMESELRHGIPYAQWRYPNNPIHRLQWRLTRLAIRLVENSKKDPGYPRARHLLDQGLHSCQYWWAGAVPWWGIKDIEMGAHILKSTIHALRRVPKTTKEEANEIYIRILLIAHEWERSGKSEKKSLLYTAKIRQELFEELPE